MKRVGEEEKKEKEKEEEREKEKGKEKGKRVYEKQGVESEALQPTHNDTEGPDWKGGRPI